MARSQISAAVSENRVANVLSNGDSALFLRIGLGLVFIIGGYNKLSQLLDPESMAAIVASYMGTSGYINEFFITFLFSDGSLLTPWAFLTILSTFELFSGLALAVGLMVRPLALIYAFLLWTFVFSLPVVTTPGVELTVKTYTSPAMFVQVRDIAMSGLMFVLYQLGSGRYSLDSRILVNGVTSEKNDWNNLGLLLRLSLAAPFIIGGIFGSFANISTFATPKIILLMVGLLLVMGVQVRILGGIVAAVMLWYMFHKLNLDRSLIANLNGFKREFAFLAAGLILILRGAGDAYTPRDILNRISQAFGRSTIATGS